MASHDVAILRPSSSELTVGLTADGIQALEARFTQIREWLREEATLQETSTAAKDIRDLSNWLRIRKTANALRIQAMQIEATALRRLGKAGFLDSLRPIDKTLARWFAGMDQDEFDEALQQIAEPESLPTWRMRVLRGKEQAQRQDAAENVLKGNPVSPADPSALSDKSEGLFPERRELHDAAVTLLAAVVAQHHPFRIDESALSLAAQLREEVWNDTAGHVLLARLIGFALDVVSDRSPELYLRWRVDGAVIYVPTAVTYEEDDLGWVRVPWSTASPAQLEAMVAHRTQQANEAAGDAENLRRLADVIRDSKFGDTCEERLDAAWNDPRFKPS